MSRRALQIDWSNGYAVAFVSAAAAVAAARHGLFVVLLGAVADVVEVVGEPVVAAGVSVLAELALLDD